MRLSSEVATQMGVQLSDDVRDEFDSQQNGKMEKKEKSENGKIKGTKGKENEIEKKRKKKRKRKKGKRKMKKKNRKTKPKPWSHSAIQASGFLGES